MPAPVQTRHGDESGPELRLLSFNIQAGAHFERYRHYVTRPWRHVLPHGARRRNLDKLATLVADYDIVALQEADAGSLRSGFLNQIEFLAERAGFGWFSVQTNRRIGGITHTCNALLMRQQPTEVRDYALPGTLPGRGALWARFGEGENALLVVVVHLSLGPRARARQIDFLCSIIDGHRNVVVMGDFNCPATAPEMLRLYDETPLAPPVASPATFPSWAPVRGIDHILLSDSLEALRCDVPSVGLSDHLPLAMTARVPRDCPWAPPTPEPEPETTP
jgi:endonuclease/exonuclease/phosphatase family metal-dependent hydrolase